MVAEIAQAAVQMGFLSCLDEQRSWQCHRSWLRWWRRRYDHRRGGCKKKEGSHCDSEVQLESVGQSEGSMYAVSFSAHPKRANMHEDEHLGAPEAVGETDGGLTINRRSIPSVDIHTNLTPLTGA